MEKTTEATSPHNPDDSTEAIKAPRIVPVQRLLPEDFDALMQFREAARAKPGLDFLRCGNDEDESK